MRAERDLAMAIGQEFELDDPNDPLDLAEAIEHRMAETPARTIDGVLAQLRLVQQEADEHGCFSNSADAALRNMAASLEALASGRAAV